jgi:hypothetical protein
MFARAAGCTNDDALFTDDRQGGSARDA